MSVYLSKLVDGAREQPTDNKQLNEVEKKEQQQQLLINQWIADHPHLAIIIIKYG